MTERETGETMSDAVTLNLMLQHAGLSVSPEERESLLRMYAYMRTTVTKIRVPEMRSAEPSIIYSATEPGQKQTSPHDAALPQTA